MYNENDKKKYNLKLKNFMAGSMNNIHNFSST